MSTATSNDHKMNVMYLMTAQACFSATSMTYIAFAGLAGGMIASDRALATLPISLTMVFVALSTGPLSLLMQKYSRQRVFLACAFSGLVGALVAALGVYTEDFVLFCAASLFLGPFQASAAYYRFAAGESVSTSRAPRAISLVLLGGIFAALVTPAGNEYFNELFLPYTFVGAFVFSAVASIIAFIPLSLLKKTGGQEAATTVQSAERGKAEELDAGNNNADNDGEARPLSVIARQPAFVAAVANGGLGFAMMVFVMTATPIAMVDFCGFASSTSTKVVSAHVIAMFLPSLFTGNLIMRFGVLPILLCGHILFAVAFIAALSGIELANFSVALVALGIGWNFCFIGGTTLLTRVHRPEEKGKVQGLNEVLIFAATALASLAAGAILRFYGWAIVNQAAFVMLVLAASVTIYWGVRHKTETAVAA